MEFVIPLFPCKWLERTIDFYQTLGFEITHRQEQPYLYGAVRRDNVEIHFSGLGVWKAKHGVCLMMVQDVKSLHATFANALRSQYGKVPTAGFPRITRFRKGQTRFHIFDPDGNVLVHIDQTEADGGYYWEQAKQSALASALENAVFLRDVYCHDEAAAKALDKALAQHRDVPPLDRARALAARAELAVAMHDLERADVLRAELKQIPISDEDRQHYADELQAADELQKWL